MLQSRSLHVSALIVAALVTVGCQSRPEAVQVTTRQQIGPQHAGSPSAGTVLLFDATPSRFPASAFADRADWPSVPGRVPAGEITYYRERFVDYQSLHHPEYDYSYRRFETYREGTTYK